MSDLTPPNKKPSYLRWVPPAKEHGAWAVLLGSYLGAWALHRDQHPPILLVVQGAIVIVCLWFAILSAVEAFRLGRRTRAEFTWGPLTLLALVWTIPNERFFIAAWFVIALVPIFALSFRFMTRQSGKRGLLRIAVGVCGLESVVFWGSYLFTDTLHLDDLWMIAGLFPFFVAASVAVKWVAGKMKVLPFDEETQHQLKIDYAIVMTGSLLFAWLLTLKASPAWGVPLVYIPVWIFGAAAFADRLHPKSIMNVGWSLLIMTFWTVGALGWLLGR